jgi:glutathione peroxidase
MTEIRDIPLKTIAGEQASLADYAGEVLLIVNTASKCGLTPQYEGLQALYDRYCAQGFRVLGFPSNDFRGQEPGTEAEIADFCKTSYDVAFPLFAKVTVAGPDKHPLFAALIDAEPKVSPEAGGEMRAKLQGHGIAPNPEPEILWNFEKFVVGRDGQVVARFAPDVAPDDEALIRTIERELVPSE